LALPLRRLTQKNREWKWEAEEQQAFQNIKDAICDDSTLVFFDTKLHTKLLVDASPTGVGAILAQVQRDGTTKAVAYASRSLTSVESRYSQTEREALAIKFGCLKFVHYLSGDSCFTVVTDHKPLVELFKSNSRPPPRIERMALRIQDLQFNVTYQPGPSNPSDILSRQPLLLQVDTADCQEYEHAYGLQAATAAMPNGLSLEEVRQASRSDLVITAAKQSLLTGQWRLRDAETRSLYAVRHELSEVNDILLRGERLVVPAILRLKTLQLAHTGHMGIHKTIARLHSKVWWPGMAAAAESMVRSCTYCAACSNEAECKAAPMQPTPLPEGPWLSLGIDFLCVQNDMLLVCVDHYSRFPVVQFFRNTNCAAVLDKLAGIFRLLGTPLEVTSDNGPPFSAAEFSAGLAKMGVKHRRITPLYPQSNGITERLNRALNKAIRAAIAEGKNWKMAVEDWLMAYRLTPHSATKAPPADIMFGRKVNGPIPCASPSAPLSVTREDLLQQDASAKKRMKSYADRVRGARLHHFKVGDKVLRRLTRRKKTDPFFDIEAWTIVEIKGDSFILSRRGVSCMRHITHIKALPDYAPLGEDGVEEALPPTPRPSPIVRRQQPQRAAKDAALESIRGRM
jgi:putative transposase